MGDYSIRKYNKRDYNAVRKLFAQGMLDYIPGTALYLFKLPQVCWTILAVSITLQLCFQSYVLSLVSIGALLAAVHGILTLAINLYIKKVHNSDLQNIEESYIQRHNSCFWVVESCGQIVGMVGIQPAPNSNSDMILRRMSVAKEQQRRGIARALCVTAFNFARQRGYKHVTLDTSTLQVSAHKLYQRLGFKTTKIIPSRSLLGRFANMVVVYYSYEV